MPDRSETNQVSSAGKERLKNLTISFTLACNQGCAHCWVNAGAAHPEEMSNDDICSILLQAREMGVEHVKFTGGEPLLRRGLADILSLAAGLGFRLSIETNGTLITRSFISAIESFIEKLHFYVSLDGASPETHDSFRAQRGAFRRTVSNLELLRKANGYFSIHTVVRRDNLHEIPEIFQLAKLLGASQHKLILSIHNIGRGAAIQESAITSDELFELLKVLPEQEFWDYTWSPSRTRNTRLMTTLPPAFQPDGRSATCGWGQTFLAVLANGDAALCQGLYDVDEAKAGNVLKTSLAAVWEAAPLLIETRQWRGTDLHGICSNCAVADTCRGLCRASAMSTYHNLRAPYPLCQTFYEEGKFPEHMLINKERNCTYTPEISETSSALIPLEIIHRRRVPLAVSPS